MTRMEAINCLSRLTGEDVGRIINEYNDPASTTYTSIMINGYDLAYIVDMVATEELEQ